MFSAIDSGITALIPCYNEVECIEPAYAEIRKELSRYQDVEILFVDDGSTDGTLDFIKAFAADDPRVRYLSFSRNYGLEAAFSAGFRYASKRWTVQFDADLQSPPAAMHLLVAKAAEGYDVVFGVRQDRQDPWARRVGSQLQHLLARRLAGIELPMGASVFRMVRTSVARKIVELKLGTPYFIATVPLVGARYATVLTPHQARQGGRGKWTVRKLVSHALELFVGFSYRPLEMVYALALVAVLIGVPVLLLAMIGVAGPGWLAGTGLAMEIGLAGGVALLSRYLVRVLRSQPGVPQYLIRESNLPIDPADDLYQHEHIRIPAQRRPESP